MDLLGRWISAGRTKGQDLVTRLPTNQWWPVIRESFAGAWQRNVVTPVQDVMTHSTAWACITLIASDVGKLRLKLVQEDATDDICTEVIGNSPYLSVLKKPNHFQNRIKFLESWIISKLTRGNAYILKERNHRGGQNQGTVDALYVLDPARVQPMVAPDGSIFYSLAGDYLSGVPTESIVVPASEIIHDVMVALYHPLVGVSPIHACGRAVVQGLKIQQNTERLFENGSQPSGVLTAPLSISDDVAKRIQEHWNANFSGERNIGKVAVLGDGLKFEPMAMTAVDAQLIDQLKWGDEKVCSVFHVPPYMVGVGPSPTYNNIEALNQQYYSQCLQALIEAVELCLKEGLEIADPKYVELDLEGLLRMDSATKMESATKGVKGGVYTPNEARQLFNKKPLTGGDTVYLQQQDYSIDALNRRDQASPAPSSQSPAPHAPAATVPLKEMAAEVARELHLLKAIAAADDPPDPDQTDDALTALESAWDEAA